MKKLLLTLLFIIISNQSIADEDFYQGHWQAAIKTALSLTVKDKIPLNGEIEILEIVHQILL